MTLHPLYVTAALVPSAAGVARGVARRRAVQARRPRGLL